MEIDTEKMNNSRMKNVEDIINNVKITKNLESALQCINKFEALLCLPLQQLVELF